MPRRLPPPNPAPLPPTFPHGSPQPALRVPLQPFTAAAGETGAPSQPAATPTTNCFAAATRTGRGSSRSSRPLSRLGLRLELGFKFIKIGGRQFPRVNEPRRELPRGAAKEPPREIPQELAGCLL